MTRTYRYLLLLLLFIVLVARVPYAATNMDGARDFFTAWRLLHGEAIPLSGPLLAGAIHLGPVWFFFLAALLGVTGGHGLATTLIVGALASLQIPLAYLAGKAIHSRRAGMLWACALVLPSWATFEALWPSHPQFVAPLMLAFIVCAARFDQRPRRRYLLGMALAFVLALHAHPCSIVLVWIGGFVLVRSARRGHLRVVDVVLAMLIVFAPLAPFFYWDASRGFADLAAARSFVGQSDLAANLANTWGIVRGSLWNATPYWFGTMLAWPASASGTATFVIMIGNTLGLVGIARMLLQRETRDRALLACGLLVAVLLTTAALRSSTPFYMTISIQVIATGLVGMGLAALGESRPARAARGGVAAIALFACLLVDVGIARIQTRGAWPFAWFPVMDVSHPPSTGEPLMLLPAYALSASGAFLCSHDALSVHGGYASALLQTYAIDMRLTCGHHDLLLGGSEPEREHWLGLSRAMFARLDVEPALRIGPVGLVRATPFGPGTAIALQTEPVYPAYHAQVGATQTVRVRVPLTSGQHLVVSDLAFVFDTGYTVTASIDGRPLASRADDAISHVYACEACAAASSAVVELTLPSGNLKDIDVAVF